MSLGEVTLTKVAGSQRLCGTPSQACTLCVLCSFQRLGLGGPHLTWTLTHRLLSSLSSYEEITVLGDQARQEEAGAKQVNELPSRVQTGGPRSQRQQAAEQRREHRCVWSQCSAPSLPGGRDPSSLAATPGRAGPRECVKVES